MKKVVVFFSLIGVLAVSSFFGGMSKSVTTKENTISQAASEKNIIAAKDEVKVEETKKVLNLNLDSSRLIKIEGEIGEGATQIAKQISRLGKDKKPIYLLLNSPGGSVIDGGGIIAAMQASASPVYTVNLQLCASMCAIIHQYGTKRYAVDRSILMFHSAAGGVQGTLEHMNSLLTTLTRYVYKMDSYVAKRSGLTLEQFHDITVRDLWIDAEDAVERKLVDSIVSVDYDEEKPFSVLGAPSTPDENQKNNSRFNLTW